MAKIDAGKLKIMSDTGFNYRLYCTQDEKERYLDLVDAGDELPEGVYSDGLGDFYKYLPSCFEPPSLQEHLLSLQIGLLKTIKKFLAFFAVIVSIGLILGIFLGLTI